MKNWKTSLAGIAGGLTLALPQLLAWYQGQGGDWSKITLGGIILLLGILAKDFNVTNAPNPTVAQTVDKAPVDRNAALAKLILIGLIPAGLALSLCACSSVFTPANNAAAQKQILADLYNGASSAATQSIMELAQGNEQNGQDVIQGYWTAAAESAGINAIAHSIVIYGTPALQSLEAWVQSKLHGVPPQLQKQAVDTIGTALQNTINANATTSAKPTSATATGASDAAAVPAADAATVP